MRNEVMAVQTGKRARRRNHESNELALWFPGSAWEPTTCEALPRVSCRRGRASWEFRPRLSLGRRREMSLAHQREVFRLLSLDNLIRQRRLSIVLCRDALHDWLGALAGGVGCFAARWRPINLDL